MMFGLDLGMIFGGLGAFIAAVFGIYAKTQSIRAERAERDKEEAESEANSVYQRMESQEAISKIKQQYAENQQNAVKEKVNRDSGNVVDNGMWNDD